MGAGCGRIEGFAGRFACRKSHGPQAGRGRSEEAAMGGIGLVAFGIVLALWPRGGDSSSTEPSAKPVPP